MTNISMIMTSLFEGVSYVLFMRICSVMRLFSVPGNCRCSGMSQIDHRHRCLALAGRRAELDAVPAHRRRLAERDGLLEYALLADSRNGTGHVADVADRCAAVGRATVEGWLRMSFICAR